MTRTLPGGPRRSARLVALLAIAGAAALATVGPLTPMPAAADPAPAATAAAPLNGGWRTFASGDRVNRILRDGELLWSATEGGGLLRWDLAANNYRQYLAPQDGLLSNDVYALAKAPDGRLWLATGRALSVLDPANGAVLNFTPETSPGMPTALVTAVKASADGKLWVGFSQSWDPLTVDPVFKRPGSFRPGGLARFDPNLGVWDEAQHAQLKRAGGLGEEAPDEYVALPSENVTDIELGSDGILWVGTRPYYVATQLDCAPDSGSCQPGAVWVLAGGGLAARKGSEWANWTPVANELSCYASTINDLAADREGRMWVATGGRGLLLMRNGLQKPSCKGGAQPYYVRPVRDDLPGPRGNYLWSVDVAPDGRVWLGQGPTRNEGVGIAILDHHNTFDDSSAANQGQAWRFDDTWEFIDLDDGPMTSTTIVTALDLRGPGPVQLGTQHLRDGDGDGLRSLDTRTHAWQVLRTADTGIPSNEVTDVAWNAARGELWVAFLSKGVARWDGTSWQGWRAFGKGRQVAKVTLDVGTDKERIPVDLVDQAAFDAAFPTSPRYVRLGADPTLYRLTRTTLTTVGTGKYLDVAPKLQRKLAKNTPVYNVDRGPASDATTQVCFSADGTVWAGGRESIWLGAACPATWGTECWLDGGLGKFDGQLWKVYDQQTKDSAGKTIPDQEVQTCAVDGAGRVWVGSGNARTAEGDGIAYLDPVSERWTSWKKARNVAFAGNGISDIDVDPGTDNLWVAHHAAQSCEAAPFGGGCSLVRSGGGVSRWNGSKWDMWQKPAAPLQAFGVQGELSSIRVDRAAGRVWAGAWDAKPKSFHWGQGEGINATLNWCPLDCTNAAWQSKTWPEDGSVVALELDEAGRLWAGTHRSGNGIRPPEAGVKLFDGTAWYTITPANSGLPSQEITSLERQGEAMWVGTRTKGLALYSRALLPTATPPPSPTPDEATPTSPPTNSPSPVTATATPTAAPSVHPVYLPFAGR
jgi:hypothetical protein